MQPNYSEYIFEKNKNRASAVAYIDSTGTTTFGELSGSTHLFAKKLRSLGVSPGDMIVVSIPSSRKFPVVFLACITIGAIPVLIDDDSDLELLERQCQRVDAKFIIGKSNHVVNGTVSINTDNIDLSNTDATGLYHEYHSDDLLFLNCSSGSTGDPKLVRQRHGIMFDICATVRESNYKLDPDSVIMCTGKLNFGWGLSNALVLAVECGCSAVIYDKLLTGTNLINTVNSAKITHIFANPTVFRLMMRKRNKHTNSHFCCAVSTTEPLPRAIYNEFKQWSGLEIFDTYGSSEMFWTAIGNDYDQHCVGSIGKPFYKFQCRIVDENNQDCAINQPGMLLVHTATMADGYYDNAQANAKSFVQGWYRTGDIVYQDQNGFYFFINRKDQYVKINSCWTSAAEIENLLLETKLIQDCTVVFDQDSNGQTQSVAYVVPADSRVLDSAKVRGRLSKIAKSHQMPGKILFMKLIPRSSRNKRIIHKSLLDEAYLVNRI